MLFGQTLLDHFVERWEIFLVAGSQLAEHVPAAMAVRGAGGAALPTGVVVDQASEMPGRYELLVQSVTDYAIYMLDPTGIVVSWNAGAERFKGYKPDEILGQHFSKFYTPEDLQTRIPDIGRTAAGGQVLGQ